MVHVREHAYGLPAGTLPEIQHCLRELARRVEGLHERAIAHLDVEDDGVGAARDLLGHDARRDERDLVDGRRHIAQCVEELVGGNEVAGLTDDRDADLLDLRDQLVHGELDTKAGNRLELVERASGMTETTARHLPEGHAACRNDRPDGE